MKRTLLFVISMLFMQLALAQGWKAQLISSTENEIKVEVNVNGYNATDVVTPHGDAVVITNKKMFKLAQAGEPDVPTIVIPAVIGDNALMNIEVVDAQYVDYQNIEVAPSKGDFKRSINPEDVPYTYGAMYQQDAFYPAVMAKLDEPYIHRDVRGQNMMVTPYLYNPVTKTLRVYTHFIVKMVKTGEDNRNVIANRSKSIKLDSEFNKMYESRYINYTESMTDYVSIADDGELLIICHDAFMTAMEPFVAWKKQIGRPTTMVGTSEAGNTATAIKAYIQNYYTSHPNLTDILLVGDVAQIPGVYVSAGSGWTGYSGYGDLPYGQLAGNDSYNEVIVGRFCCETAAQVTSHVNKVLNYERDLDETATWLATGQGISTSAGSGGHFNEDDYQHIDNLRTDLLNYNYDNVYRDYQGVTGTTASSASVVSQHINTGVSIINYCNHGSETGWGVFGYSNSHVNALTNDYKLPYVISVACLVGKYDHSGGCFAEAWMRATNNSNSNPTGAIGGMFSYISQPWIPPMYGQDEMVDILVESYNNNIRRTMGGVSVNGNMKVLDQGATQNDKKGTYNCWILYGDPTLTLRNAVPQVMSATYSNSMRTTDNSFTVNVTDGEGALATLTFGGEILGSATVTNGVANITCSQPGGTGTATLTIFGYNKKTYVGSVDVTEGTTPTPLRLFAFADPAEIMLGQSTTLIANASGGTGNYSYSWHPHETVEDPHGQTTTATPLETTEYTATVTDGNETVSATVIVEVTNQQPVECPKPKGFSGTSFYQDGMLGVRLSWNAASYEHALDRFELYRSEDGGIGFDMIARIVNVPYVTHYERDDEVRRPGLYIYRVKAIYSNECESDFVEVSVEVPDYAAVGENAAETVAVYPNPTSGKVNIKAEGIQQITVVNVTGQVMMIQTVDTDDVMLDMSAFDNGMYLVNIMTVNGSVVKTINVLR